jgi:ADP-heptose:LPS heptosyltransferase
MKIVVLRQLGGIGDCLMLSCVFKGLRERYPDAHITWILNDQYASGALVTLARHNPYIDEYIHIDPLSATSIKTRTAWGNLYGAVVPIEEEFIWRNANLCIDLNTSCVDYEWAASKTPEGIQRPRVDLWCDAAEVNPSSKRPVYLVKPEEAAWAQEYKEKHWPKMPIVGMGLNAADKKRSVPQEILFGIAQKLLEQGYYPVTIDTTLTYRGVDRIIGKPLAQVMALMGQMDVVVTADSGILHMAGALDVPLVGLFGSTDPEMRMNHYRGSATVGKSVVPCSPCWYDYPCIRNAGTHPVPERACFHRINPGFVGGEVSRWRKKMYTPLTMV